MARIKNLCSRVIFSVSLIGITTTISAQIDRTQFNGMDSVEFHQWWKNHSNIRSIQVNTRNTASDVSYFSSFTVGGNENTFYPVSFDGWYVKI